MARKKAKRQHLLPEVAAPKSSYVYLLGLTDGRIKIGVTRLPHERLKTHSKTMDIAWIHFTSPMRRIDAFGAEYEVKRHYFDRGQRQGHSEIIVGATKMEILTLIRTHIFDTAISRQRDAELHREMAREQEAWAAFRAHYMALSPELIKAAA